MLFGLLAIFFPGKTITLVYASAGALLFSIYLIYDTQVKKSLIILNFLINIISYSLKKKLMMGGSHKFSISPEEYVFAALNLYLDIVQIFMYILTIIGATRD